VTTYNYNCLFHSFLLAEIKMGVNAKITLEHLKWEYVVNQLKKTLQLESKKPKGANYVKCNKGW